MLSCVPFQLTVQVYRSLVDARTVCDNREKWSNLSIVVVVLVDLIDDIEM